LARLWHEEMKCLFLRCRNPPDGAIESLITEIFNYELYSNEAIEIICHSKRVLGEQILTPSRLDINEFITHEVGERLLKRYLSSTNKDKLR
ncbi:29309_t:CDS:2, partial [Racocetra persica]